MVPNEYSNRGAIDDARPVRLLTIYPMSCTESAISAWTIFLHPKDEVVL
jgi:hypothetical protein